MRISDWSSDVCSSDLLERPDAGNDDLVVVGSPLRIAEQLGRCADLGKGIAHRVQVAHAVVDDADAAGGGGQGVATQRARSAQSRRAPAGLALRNVLQTRRWLLLGAMPCAGRRTTQHTIARPLTVHLARPRC